MTNVINALIPVVTFFLLFYCRHKQCQFLGMLNWHQDRLIFVATCLLQWMGLFSSSPLMKPLQQLIVSAIIFWILFRISRNVNEIGDQFRMISISGPGITDLKISLRLVLLALMCLVFLVSNFQVNVEMPFAVQWGPFTSGVELSAVVNIGIQHLTHYCFAHALCMIYGMAVLGERLKKRQNRSPFAEIPTVAPGREQIFMRRLLLEEQRCNYTSYSYLARLLEFFEVPILFAYYCEDNAVATVENRTNPTAPNQTQSTTPNKLLLRFAAVTEKSDGCCA